MWLLPLYLRPCPAGQYAYAEQGLSKVGDQNGTGILARVMASLRVLDSISIDGCTDGGARRIGCGGDSFSLV